MRWVIDLGWITTDDRLNARGLGGGPGMSSVFAMTDTRLTATLDLRVVVGFGEISLKRFMITRPFPSTADGLFEGRVS